MRKRVAIAIIGVLALTAGLAASGCTGGSDAEAGSPVDISQLRADLEERFSGAPWYGHITAIKWANGNLEVRTDASPGEGLRPPCGEILKLAFQQGEPGTVSVGVAMFGAGGVPFGGCG